MELLLNRKIFTDKSTIGELYVDGVYECVILEDVVREIPGRPVAEWKIDKQTAIPCGRFKVIINRSARFSRKLGHDVFLCLLIGVMGFSGIRIHSGIDKESTEGCLIPGRSHGQDCVQGSLDAKTALQAKVQEALDEGEEVWIEVTGVPE